MKELNGKVTFKSSNLPQKNTVNKLDLFDEIKVAYGLNFFFTSVGKNLASKVQNPSKVFCFSGPHLPPFIKLL